MLLRLEGFEKLWRLMESFSQREFRMKEHFFNHLRLLFGTDFKATKKEKGLTTELEGFEVEKVLGYSRKMKKHSLEIFFRNYKKALHTYYRETFFI